MEGVVQPRTKGKFLTSLNASRKENLELSFSQAAKLAKEKKGAVLFERLEEGQLYTPFTDCDHYTDSAERPSDEYIDEVQEKMLANLGKLVNDQFEDKHMGSFGMAIRHGYHEEKKVFKLSWRCYFLGFVITLSEMKKAIVSKGLHKAGVGSLDASPYNKNQLLGCVGFQKTKTDKRILEPIMNYELPLENFMVQNISGNETILRYDCEEQSDETCTEHIEDSGFDSVRFAPPWDILELLIMSLDVQKRCALGSYELWARVGWAIAGVARAYKINRRFEDGLELWLQFCRQCMDMYVKDPMKARIVYLGAKRENHQLGWKSLMDALKEDNLKVFDTIEKQLSKLSAGSQPVENLADQKVLKKFIKNHFHHQPKHVKEIVVTMYESGKFIIASTDETTCPIIEEDHEETYNPYIVIGLKAARDKCRHEDCKDKTNIVIDATQYPEDVKLIVQKLLTVQLTPEAAIQNFVIEHKATNFSKIEDLELGQVNSSPFGNRYMLTKNRFCQICNCHHPNPENCIIVDQTAKLLAMECRLNPYNFHPPGGISIPQNVTNIIIQNQVINVGESGPLADDAIFDETFGVFSDQELNRLVNISLKGFAYDVAQVFLYLGRQRFGVQTGDRDTWWAWDDTEMRWMQSAHKANLFCAEVVAGTYQQVVRWLKQQTVEDDKRGKRIQRIEALLRRLKDKDQHSILSQAAILLKEEKRGFENLLDSNKNILNFQGQIFDFETCSLRAALPSDYVSRTTGYKLPEKDEKEQAFVMQFLRSVMPDEAHVEYLLTWLASCLDGWNREETFSILSGSGRNGKSLLRDLLASAFGDTPATGYFGVVAASLLTKERPSSDRPVADLLHMKGKRLLIASEPEKGARINCGFLKFLTGNDPINGRWLQSNAEISFQPQHSLALLCNSIPNLDANDEAVWDRSRVLNFPHKFVSRPTQEHHRKSDPFLKSKLPKMGPQLMLILLDFYKRYRQTGLEPTAEMLRDTDDVRQEEDIYTEFISRYYQNTQSPDDHVVYQDLTSHCKLWKESHPIYRDKLYVFSREDLKSSMIRFTGREVENQRPPDNKKLPTRKCWTRVVRLSEEETCESESPLS